MSGKSLSELLKNYQGRKTVSAKEKEDVSEPKYSFVWSQIESFLKERGKENSKELAPIQKNLGILLIIIDDLPNELLWRAWLHSYEGEFVKIWIHAKEPQRVKSKWVQERLVKTFQFHPRWGSIELTKVMLGLLNEAISEAPEINKFAFASESCLPMVPLEKALSMLYDEHDQVSTSWVNGKDVPNNGFANMKQFMVLEKEIPREHIWKADQWVVISRHHGLEILELCRRLQSQTTPNITMTANTPPPLSTAARELNIAKNPIFHIFRNTNASDELFFPTVLSMLGHRFTSITESSRPQQAEEEERAGAGAPAVVLRRRVTFADWEGCVDSPKTFYSFAPEIFLAAREEGTIFFRKLKCLCFLESSCPIEEKMSFFQQWLDLVYEPRNTEAEDRQRLVEFARGFFLRHSSSAERDEPPQKKKARIEERPGLADK